MKRLFVLLLGICFIVSGCLTPQQDTVFQVSTIDALLAGVYDGDLSCHQLLKKGDFGIGTFDRLDGEMIVVDGNVFQVKADGKVYKPELSVNTPFATVCRFNPETSISLIAGLDFESVEELINKQFPNQNLFYAIKIKGHFKTMKTRSVPGQQKPYPPLGEVTKNQPEFEMEDISGTIIGFRCPAFVKGINVPGYHLHFLSDDCTKGGHIMSFQITEGSCDIDVLSTYSLQLPTSVTGFAETDLSKDRSKELKDVEKRK